jgi:hypothetical protein
MTFLTTAASITTFIRYLLSNPRLNSLRPLIISTFQMRKLSLRVTNSPRFFLGRDRARIQTQVCLTPEP